jgi:hypothetical protein
MFGTAEQRTVQRDRAEAEPETTAGDVSPRPAAGRELGGAYRSGAAVHLGPMVQAKLDVGSPGDPYEREADAVSDRAVSGGAAPRISTISGRLGPQRSAEHEEKDEAAAAGPDTGEAQAKCDGCESGESLQRSSAPEADRDRRGEDVPKESTSPPPDTVQSKCAPCAAAEPSAEEPVQREEDDSGDDGPVSDGSELAGSRSSADGEQDARADATPTGPAAHDDDAEDAADAAEAGEPDEDEKQPEEDLGCGEGGAGGAGEKDEEGGEGEEGAKGTCGSAPEAAAEEAEPAEPAEAGGEEAMAGTEQAEPVTEAAPSPACAPGGQPAPAEAAAGEPEGDQEPPDVDDEDGAVQRAELDCEKVLGQRAAEDEVAEPGVPKVAPESEPEDPDAEENVQLACDCEPVAAPEGNAAPAQTASLPPVPGARPPRSLRGRPGSLPGPGRGGPLHTDLAAQQIQARGAGEPLAPSVRTRLERTIGVDLGAVRVHADAGAQAASKALRAKAFTHRNHIFLGAGRSPHDVGLMAHESTHVLQQRALERRPPAAAPAGGKAAPPAGAPGEPAKPEASRRERAAPAPGVSVTARVEARPAAPGARPAALPVEPSKLSDTPEQDVRIPQREAASEPRPVPGARQATPDKPGAAEGKATTKAPAAAGGTPAAGGPTPEEGPPPGPAAVDPAADPRFAAVIHRLGAASKYEKSLGEPRMRVEAAEAAVKPAEIEGESRAGDAQVTAMSAGAESGERPKLQTFRQVLEQALDSIKPKNMEQTLNFKGSGKAETLRDGVKGALNTQKETATKPLADAAKAPLQANRFQPPTPPDLKPDPADPAQRSLRAEEVLPKPKRPREFTFDPQKLEMQRLMDENDLDEDQLHRANEPQAEQALEAKHEFEAHADKAPEVYREHEQQVLSTEAKQVAKQGTHTLVAMRHKRKQAKGTMRSAQDNRKNLEELERQQVYKDVRSKYGEAKTAVEERLTALDGTVGTMFDDAEKAARKVFEDHVDARMRAYKADRYSGITGKLAWVWDKITSIPDEVNVFYVEGTCLYIQSMSRSFDGLAKKVEEELAEAKKDVDKKKKDIADYVAGLDGKKKTWGQEAFDSISGDFDALEASVEDKKQDLASDLAQRYRDSRKKLDERIEQLKEENQGLLAKFKAFIKKIIDVLKKLKDLAMMLLRVGGQILRGLLKDPVGFLGNLFSAIRQGFTGFGERIGTHLKDALISFVTGSVREIGISAAADANPRGVFGLVLQLLGITVDRLKEKVARRVGARNVERVQEAWSKVSGLFANGATALWERAKEHLGDMQERVESELKDWIGTRIVQAGLTWIISLFSPASALFRAIKMIYDVVSFFLSNIDRIVDLVNGVLASVSAVVEGRLDAAAKRVEMSLAKGLALLLGFLASLLGLSGIGARVRSIVTRVRPQVDRAIDAVLAAIVRGLKAVAAGGRRVAVKTKAAAGRAARAVREFLFPRRAFTAGKERHQLFFQGKGPEARLVIASDTESIEAFVLELRGRPENRQGDGKAALDEVDRQVKLIAKAKKEIETHPEAAKARIDGALAVIAEKLKLALSRTAVATKDKPVALDYPKRASARYPKVYVGPIVGGGPRIKQDDLAQARHGAERKQKIADALPAKAQEDWQKRGMPIEEYDPHGRKALPLGETIGLAPERHTNVGKRLTLPRTKGRTPGGGKINAALAPYGYSPKGEYQDGDHVIEMQLGGEDVLENLWPLDASENRGAGSVVRGAQFDTAGGGRVSMEELKARARKGTDVWLVLTKTKSV